MTLAVFLLGLVLLTLGGDLLVRGASGLALAAGLSRLTVGLTVIAAGTSAPEVAVGVNAAIAERGGIALGNVIGSNIANVLLILGAAALVRPFAVPSAALRRDLPVVLGATLLVIGLAADGSLSRGDGALLVLGQVGVLVATVLLERRAAKAEAAKDAVRNTRKTLYQLAATAAGLALLVLGADWVVKGAVAGARTLGWSEMVIGLTVVAVGTSLPELVASSASAFRGEGGLAVGNVLGSNSFNLLGVLGAALLVSPSPLLVDRSTLLVDLPIAFAAAALCVPIFARGLRVARIEGAVLLCCFAAYTAFTVGAAK
jgi:cation:H+ antiporter